MQCCVDICVHVRFIFHALVCEVMRDVLPSLPLKCDIMFMITCMFISACMFIITSCPHLNCHFLMNKLSLPMAVDSFPSLSLSLSPPSFSLWLQDTCHLMPFTKYPLLNQSYFFTPYPSIAHIKFTNYSPTIFYDYHPQSCLKNIFFALGPTVL